MACRTAGRADTREMFDIKNQGVLTEFVPLETTPTNAPFISDFDKFQKNLLRNYSDYSRMFHPADSAR